MMVVEQKISPLGGKSFFQTSILLFVFLVILGASFARAETEPKAPEPQSEKAEKSYREPSPALSSNLQSLFFSTDDIDSIGKAKLAYQKRRSGVVAIDEEDFLKKLETIANKKLDLDPASFTYPQFFLSSIAYYSPRDWVVWVNGEKIVQNSGESPSGLRVIDINREKVTFEWKPERMDKIIDVGATSAESPVHVDMVNNKVTFSLKGNQTFTSYAMKVVEGKLKPVSVAFAPDARQPAKAIPQDAIAKNKLD